MVIPCSCLRSIIVPIAKDNNKDPKNVKKYRPIALATTFSKLFECFILHQIEPFFNTADNQFGHSTDMGVFLLKQGVSLYVKHYTPVFSVFLDASKAFDRVNHSKLFKKLIMRKVPRLHVLFVCLIIGTAI